MHEWLDNGEGRYIQRDTGNASGGKMNWHDLLEPDQNFGILAKESLQIGHKREKITGSGVIQKMEFNITLQYLILDITMDNMKEMLANNTLYMGLDTYQSEQGQFRYKESIPLKAPTGMEFLLEIKSKDGFLKVAPDYNPQKGRFMSKRREDGVFDILDQLKAT